MNILSLFGETSTYYNDSHVVSDPTVDASILAFFVIFTLIATAISYVIWSFFLSRIFKKAGIESWKAWVPVYSTWILLELGNQKGYWAVLAFIPVVGIVSGVFMYIAMYHIGLKLGKDGVFVLLAIFLPLVWLIWLALDKSVWQGGPTPILQPVTSVPTTATPNQAVDVPVNNSPDNTTPTNKI